MKIRDVNFDFDILRAGDADRLQQAVNALQATAASVPRTSGLGDIIRANCVMIDDFLAAVLGEGYDAALRVPTDDLRALRSLYAEVLAEIARVKDELQPLDGAAANPAAVAAQTDLQVQARQAGQAAAQSLPQPPTPASAAGIPFPAAQPPAPDFARMNRAQRRAWVKGLKGGT